MPMPIQGLVGQPSSGASANTSVQPRFGPLSETVVTEAHGKYYEPVRNNQTFTTTTPGAGVAIVSYGSTAAGFLLYNPINSGVKAELIVCKVGYVSGTQTAGFLCYATNILSTSAAPTGTAQTILSNNVGSGKNSALTAFTTATVVAMQLFEPFGVNVFAATASAIIDPWSAVDAIDGRIVLNPGTWFNVAGSVAGFGTYVVSLSWNELPISA